MSSRQRGHFSGVASSETSRVASTPQWGQKRLPWKIGAKHDGQVTVASAHPQYAQAASAVLAGAPQPGHLSTDSGMA